LQGYNQRLAAKLEEKVAELEDAYTRLEQQSRRNELILGSVGEGVFGIDRQGHATFVNEAAAQMAGLTAAEMLGQPIHNLLHHSRPDGTPYPFDACPSHRVLTDGAVHRIQDEVFWHTNGTSFPVEYLARLFSTAARSSALS
jgi:PAS domain S-box-containing protein